MEQARPGRKVQGTESLGGGGIVQGQERVLKTGGGRVQELEVALPNCVTTALISRNTCTSTGTHCALAHLGPCLLTTALLFLHLSASYLSI